MCVYVVGPQSLAPFVDVIYFVQIRYNQGEHV